MRVVCLFGQDNLEILRCYTHHHLLVKRPVNAGEREEYQYM